MKIYLGGRFHQRGLLRQIRTRLETQGHTVVASWIDRTRDSHSAKEQASEGLRDWSDIVASDLTVFDSSKPTRRGGRCVEQGLALASGVPVWIVGERRHVYDSLSSVTRFPTWAAALRALR